MSRVSGRSTLIIYQKVHLPVGLTDNGIKCLSRTTSEHVASKPMPRTIDESILSVTICNKHQSFKVSASRDPSAIAELLVV